MGVFKWASNTYYNDHILNVLLPQALPLLREAKLLIFNFCCRFFTLVRFFYLKSQSQYNIQYSCQNRQTNIS